MGGRWEERYLVPTPQLSELERVLEDLGFERIEYATPFNKTIYFDNRECEVPFEYSIKARKYDSSPWAERGSLEGEDWIFELKSTDVEVWKISKKKVRKKCALEDLLKEVGKIKQLGGVRFSQPLEPRMGNCYLRTHFSRGDIRVTLDRDISYYEVLSGQLVKVGEEEGYGRVEVKIPTDSVELDLLGEVRRTIFEEFGGVPTISKKDMGHDFLR
ncbi:MAG TPA: hypothetical protein ENF51_01580, partial [Candidatus Aenigmarchaeota archaeon]|nr:hypothetical protein [Candidatus Aenigmarchaeota archaeon]